MQYLLLWKNWDLDQPLLGTDLKGHSVLRFNSG